LGSQKNILDAKLEILHGIPHNGTVILNNDDDMLYAIKDKLPYNTVTFGTARADCDIRADCIELGALESRFTVRGDQYTVPAPGLHHVYNALAAIAVGCACGVDTAGMQKGIAAFVPEDMRQTIVELNGVRIIEDCYNANPESMRAALAVLSGTDKPGRRIAVLGDMLELGDHALKEHRSLGGVVAQQRVDLLITIGRYAADTAVRAGELGVEALKFDNNADAAAFLTTAVNGGDTVLLKASRGSKFEEISQALMAGLC
jgi:UDP-N-acetylmuramoyl-tripeptide--D-alanyl-D-alanine ligase